LEDSKYAVFRAIRGHVDHFGCILDGSPYWRFFANDNTVATKIL